MMAIRGAWIVAALAVAAVHQARAEIPIGFSTPLTGTHAWVGEPHLAGTELAIDDLNAKGGILGESLELILVDDGCNAELAPLAAEKLVSEAVAVAFGATCSGAAIAASKVYRRAGILMVGGGRDQPAAYRRERRRRLPDRGPRRPPGDPRRRLSGKPLE
jgi:branched-chain amino acid transport system substrate-binding protein